MTIRGERPEDASRVRHVNEVAFGRPAEADLVERLRRACTDSLSLVAEDDAVVGHILFTPVVVESAGRRVLGMGGPGGRAPGSPAAGRRLAIGAARPEHPPRARLSVRCRRRTSGVLPAVRVRACFDGRPCQPMGGRA